MIKVFPVRDNRQTKDAAALMRQLVDANKLLYYDDLETIEEYYRGSWFFSDRPEIPDRFKPPLGEILIAYLDDHACGSVAICRMDEQHCELKSMFVSPEFRRKGVAIALCNAVIKTAIEQGYEIVRLTTGERQPEARSLYAGLGFNPVKPWDENPPEGYDYFAMAVA